MLHTSNKKDRRGHDRPIGEWQHRMLPAGTKHLTAARFTVTYILVLMVFVADVLLPLGTATSCLYLIPLSFLTLWSTAKHVFRVVLLATVCAILTGVGFLQSDAGSEWLAVANRLIALTLIIVTAVLFLLRKRTERDIKVLRGILPICAYCKKVRDKKGSWQHVERYIAARSEADFSHGMCPECGRKHFPDVYADTPAL